MFALVDTRIVTNLVLVQIFDAYLIKLRIFASFNQLFAILYQNLMPNNNFVIYNK